MTAAPGLGSGAIARRLGAGHTKVVSIYSTLIILLFVTALVWQGLSVSPHASSWEWIGAEHPKYFILVLGIFMIPAHLPIYVMHGVTRRFFFRGVALFGAILVLLFSLVNLLGYSGENLLYSTQGWADDLRRPHLFSSSGQPLLVLVESILLLAAYFCTGWLIGSVFYRFGSWLGTIFILPALIPALGTEIVLSSGFAGQLLRSLHIGHPNLAVAVAVSVALTAAGVSLNYAVVRTVAVGRARAA